LIQRRSIDEVLQATSIEDVIGEYISLKRRGANLLGRCPFHDEKTPSFTVSPAKGIYKCFGCGKAGNSVSFLMEHNHLSFTESIRMLAAKYGITLEEDEKYDTEEYNEQQRKREGLLLALDYATNFFKNQLKSEEGKAVADSYFRERGFSPQTIADFDLGYSPKSWTALTQSATEGRFNLDHFEAAGLIKKREDGTFFDLFRHRVIFPIHDLSGKVIAFGGRQLEKDDRSPKYLNSPETDVYHKSHVLYGIFQAKKEIRLQNQCYLVEGYTDVITLNQSEVKNVVASSGTSLTEGQIRLIKRFTDNVTILYDGDAAGIKASLRGIDLLLEKGLNVRTVSFPEGEDPDSYCKKLGSEDFKKFLTENESDFILFKANLLFDSIGNDPIRKAEAVGELLNSISLIPDGLKRATFARECSKLMDMDEKILLIEINKKRKGKSSTSSQSLPITEEVRSLLDTPTELPEKGSYSGGQEQEKNLVRLLIQSGEKKFMEDATVIDFIINELREDEALQIEHPLYKKIIEEVQHITEQYLADHEINENFFINHTDEEVRKLAADMLTEHYELSPAWAENDLFIKTEKENYVRDLQSLFLFLKKSKLEALIQHNLEELKTIEDNEEKIQECLNYHAELTSVRNSISEILGTVIS